jgi:hypothetical protein
MKNLLKHSLLALGLVVALTNCGRSGGGSNPNTFNGNLQNPYNPAWNSGQYNQHFQQQFGPGNYQMGNCMQGAYCYQIPQCSYNNLWSGGGCGQQQYVVYPGQGGFFQQPQNQFYMGGSFSW